MKHSHRRPTPIALRMPPKLMADLNSAAEIRGISTPEMLRKATSIGLDVLKRLDYNIAKAILDSSEKAEHLPKA